MDAAIIQQSIQPFQFYSLQQCTHQQLLSHSKYNVNIYHNESTNQIFVVKEVPFSQNLLKVYRLLKDAQTLNVASVLGLTLLRIKKDSEKRRVLVKEVLDSECVIKDSRKQSFSKNVYMLIWMPKYEKNLADYVQERRKKLQPFKSSQIRSFLFQILTTLRILQSKGICHRDIKPQNILVNLTPQPRYFLCDFDQSIITKWSNAQKSPQEITFQLEYTTILYSTPEFLQCLKSGLSKKQYFDPYKMDVYSFGLTLLYICSLGKFSVDDRHIYLYSEDTEAHKEFIEEERRKYVKKDQQLKIFNNILKLMLEEDQYKRDDFETLNEKIIELLGIDNQSEQSLSTKSVKQRRLNRQKIRKSHGKGFTCGKFKKSEKFLVSSLLITLMIYFFLLIF